MSSSVSRAASRNVLNSNNSLQTDGIKGSVNDLDGINPASPEEEEFEEIPLRVDPLLQQNASPMDIDRGLRLIQSCRDGDLTVVRQMIEEGSPAGIITKSGWTPIAAAAYSGNSELVRYLLEIGADEMYIKTGRHMSNMSSTSSIVPSSPINNNSTSVESTASLSTELVEPNVTASTANINNNKNKTTMPLNGTNTPLHWACYKGHAEIVIILMHVGYGIEDADPIGNRCLHIACSGGYQDVIEILLANSAAVDQCNRYGNRPIDLVTDSLCRKLLLKFQQHTTCEWCKEPFNRIRKPSLCQHCHNVYCDVKPCSSITEVVTSTNIGNNDSAAPGIPTTVHAMRYCQECAMEMGKAEQDLRNLLEPKLEMIQNALATIKSMVEPERPIRTSSPLTATGESAVIDVANELSVMDGVDPPSTASTEIPTPQRRILTPEEVFRVLTLSQTDAESLYTAIEAAQAKSVDRDLIIRAKQTYQQLVAHVALQEEIKGLLVARPIGVRALIGPLKHSLELAMRENVDQVMLELATQVIQSAEAECTLYGCHALCVKSSINPSRTSARDLARLEASIEESMKLGVSAQLLRDAIALRDRLNADKQLQVCLQPYTVLTKESGNGGDAVIVGYRFEDTGIVVDSLLQALEMRNQKIQNAVDVGTSVEGVSTVMLEEGANVLKQLKKEIKEELKAEEERKRALEEAALKAAKKGKKKKA